MVTEKRQNQIDRMRLALAETTKSREELTEEDVEAIVQRLYGEDRQEAKRRWQSQLSENPVRDDTLTLAVSDAKRHLADIVRLANRQGESVVIERSGKPVAAVISFADFVEYQLLQREGMARRYRQFIESLKAESRSRDRVGSKPARCTEGGSDLQ